MDKKHYITLAKEVLSEYPCSVHICINPYYWTDRSAICGLGDFEPIDVNKLAELLEEVSNQIHNETGDYITGLDWLDIFPSDKSLLEKRRKESEERFNSFIDSLTEEVLN